VTVGAGGDYSTINDALAYLSTSRPLYENLGVTATINLLTGFVMEEQVLVRGLNLGWVTITSVDAIVTITHTALTTDFTTTDYGFASYPAFGVSKGGVSPRIGALFQFSAAGVGGDKHGIMAIGAGSSADVLAYKGVIDAGTHGIYAAYSSTINAYAANASGAGTHGIYAAYASTINANSVDASGAGGHGIHAYHASTINADSANASGADQTGILAAYGSTINAYTAVASGAGIYGILAAYASTINADSVDASGAGIFSYTLSFGSVVGAANPVVSGPVNFGQAVNTLTNNGIIYQ
jgi:hypothetical protein